MSSTSSESDDEDSSMSFESYTPLGNNIGSEYASDRVTLKCLQGTTLDGPGRGHSRRGRGNILGDSSDDSPSEEQSFRNVGERYIYNDTYEENEDDTDEDDENEDDNNVHTGSTSHDDDSPRFVSLLGNNADLSSSNALISSVTSHNSMNGFPTNGSFVSNNTSSQVQALHPLDMSLTEVEASLESAYPLENKTEYGNLKVSSEIRDLFKHIEKYKPRNVTLFTYLKPFIPDCIPSVGEVDAMLKIPRPDFLETDGSKEDDGLGINVLDEPALNPVDTVVLELQLQKLSKSTKKKSANTKSLVNAEGKKKELNKWIDDINRLHKSQPQPTVCLSIPFADISELMENWKDVGFINLISSIKEASSYEETDKISSELMKQTDASTCSSESDHAAVTSLLSSPLVLHDLDTSLRNMVKTLCVLLDIPYVDTKLKESLYCMFTLYIEFGRNQHFRKRTSADTVEFAKYDR